MKKRVLSILLTGIVVMGLLAGCGAANNIEETIQDNQETIEDTTEETTEATSEDTSETEDAETVTTDNGKTLVVYYSAQGHTRPFAEAIAEETGADIFEIVPTESYTEEDLDWTDDNSRVSKEHDDESLRDVELTTGLGSGPTEIKNVCPNATVLEGLAVRGSSVSGSKADIESWISGLNLE